LAIDYWTVKYRVLGEDAIFFAGSSAPGRVPEAKTARCEVAQAACDGTGVLLDPVLWVQCGALAGPDPDGGYLCKEHMVHWFCEACGTQLPEFAPNQVCARCLADIEEAV
jgi:hypothetical protein